MSSHSWAPRDILGDTVFVFASSKDLDKVATVEFAVEVGVAVTRRLAIRS